MSSPWQIWKENNLKKQAEGFVTPSALFNPDTPKADDSLKQSRLLICENCPSYMKTKQCKECGCFMPIKAGLLHSVCPIGEW